MEGELVLLLPEPERAVEPDEVVVRVVPVVVDVLVLADGATITTSGLVRTVTAPSFDTRFATLFRSLTLPRVTPKPAESRLIVSRRGGMLVVPVTGPRPTLTTVAVRFGGGCGGRNRFGGLTTRGTVYQLFHPPGCHTQP